MIFKLWHHHARGENKPYSTRVIRADELGYNAIAITDEYSLSGIVRAHVEAKKRAIDLIVGSELKLQEGMKIVVLATDRQRYGELSHLISHGWRQAGKGEYYLEKKDIEKLTPHGCLVLWVIDTESTIGDGMWLSGLFPNRTWMGVSLRRNGNDGVMLAHSEKLSAQTSLPKVACGNVQLHHPNRRPLRDTLTSIRCKTPLAKLGYTLPSNSEQHLRPRSDLKKLYPAELLDTSMEIAERCDFSLDQLRYEYPDNLVPEGYTGNAR